MNRESKVIAQVFVGENNIVEVLAATDAGYRRAKQIIKDDWCWPIYWEGRELIETDSRKASEADSVSDVTKSDSASYFPK